MFRKTTTLITLAALLAQTIGLTGCSRTVSIPMREVSLDSPTIITRLKFKAGGDLSFDESGGRYKSKTRMFKGVTSGGSSRGIPLSVVDSVYFRIDPSSVESYFDAKDFHRQETDKQRHRITGPITGVYHDGQVIKFDGQHGKIDSVSRSITGRTRDGDTVTCSVDSLSGFFTKRSNATPIIHWTLGLAVVTVIGLAIYLGSNPPWDGDFKE